MLGYLGDTGAAALDTAIRESLATRAWFRRGRVAPEFAELMQAIAHAEHECYAWIAPASGQRRSVLAAVLNDLALKSLGHRRPADPGASRTQVQLRRVARRAA